MLEDSGCDDVGRRNASANWMEVDVERVVGKKGREEDWVAIRQACVRGDVNFS